MKKNFFRKYPLTAAVLLLLLPLLAFAEPQNNDAGKFKQKKGTGEMNKKFFEKYSLTIGKAEESPFMRKFNVFQDGTTPMYRDVNGTLWAMSGHSHMGAIAVFSGSCLEDMTKRWEIKTNFCVGHSEYAFNGIRYPEGILPRGSIWPFGLYICPKTHRFFCWFHNETGWNGKGTAYDAFGLCKTPKFDSDFRHVGLMHSDDEGQNWTFDRWVLAGNEAAFTDLYNPGAGNAIGQDSSKPVRFGSGDFCMFISPDDDYIYIFYNIITMDLHKNDRSEAWQRCDAYVARCRKRSDGLMGDFVKYCNGSFCESGIFGRETAIMEDAWHPRVVYSVPEKMYIMTSKPIMSFKRRKIQGGDERGSAVRIATSTDLIHWSEPELVYQDGKPWGNHYNAIISDEKTGQPSILTKNTFSFLTNHNGTDVLRYRAKLTGKTAGKQDRQNYQKEFTRKEFISNVDGVKDWYLVRQGRPGAPCIIMFHGHGSQGDQLIKRPDVIKYKTAHLVKNDYHVISPNLRGNSWMNPTVVKDLYDIIQAEHSRLNWDKLYFVSASMGGTGALIFAMHHPEMLSGVGVQGAATDLNAYVQWLKHQKTPVLKEILAAIQAAFPTVRDRKANSVLYHPDKLTMPIVFYHGGDDEIIPTEQARKFAAVMKDHPNFEYHEIPAGNHDSPLPFFPDVMTQLLRQETARQTIENVNPLKKGKVKK